MSLLKKFIFVLLICISSISSESILSKNKSELNNVEVGSSTIFNNFKSEYLLGPGDSLFITFVGLEIYSKNYLINKNGKLNLPELGDINAAGITKNELTHKLEKMYSKYIINPNLKIEILQYRDIYIYISGEIKRPGLYSSDYESDSKSNIFNKSYKLFDVIVESGGFTNNADLSNIEVIRNNSISQGGGKIKTKINFLELLNNGDQSQNISLNDGDYILINRSNNVIKEQLIAINKTNLSPKIINIYITGNVVRGGGIKMEKGSSLNQAIASAGGKKIFTGKVEYLSFNYDGTTVKRTFSYDGKAKINSFKNPILSEGDVINVKRTILGQASEVFREFSNPLFSGYGIYNLFAN